ncbi:MAG: serine/threonine-protein kinase [Gemmataceae bacterium]
MNEPERDPNTTGTHSRIVVSPPSGDGFVSGPAPVEPTATPVHLGDYTLLDELGRGGMGVVYRAEDFKLRREVALKVMLPQFAANSHAKARFVREARAQAKVEHDHVAAIHRVDEYEGLPYIVMPLLKGMTLQAALRANPRPPLPEVIRIGREVAEGLSAAHEKGLVHRDIKPANVWLEGKKLRVKVLDFGLARVTDDDGIGGSKGGLTSEGIVVGTPAYMSPEQGRGLPVDGRTDLFSLGIMLYEMTTGELPFRGSNTLALLTALAIDSPQPPAKVNPNVPQSLSDFIMQLLEKDPNNRPPTAERVAEDLRAIELGLVNAVRLVPHDAAQFPVLVPVAPDPFSALDATEASTPKHKDTTSEPATPAAERTSPPQRRGVPILAVGVLLIAIAGSVGVVLSQMGKGPTDEAQDSPPRKPDTPPKKDVPSVPTPEPPRESEFRSLFNGRTSQAGTSRSPRPWSTSSLKLGERVFE